MSGPARLARPQAHDTCSREPALRATPRAIAFPKTKIGSESSHKIAISNDDARRLVLDGVTPRTADPFGDFYVVQPRSVPIAASDGRSWGNKPETVSRTVAAYLSAVDQPEIYFRASSHPRRTADVFNEPFGDYRKAMGFPDDFRGDFGLRCRLLLDTSGEGVFVKWFRYFKNGHEVIRMPK